MSAVAAAYPANRAALKGSALAKKLQARLGLRCSRKRRLWPVARWPKRL